MPVVQPGATTTPLGLPTSPTGPGQIVATTPAEKLPTGTEQPATPADEIAAGRLTKTTSLNSTPSLGVTLDIDGKELRYYNSIDGIFYRITSEGQAEPLNDKTFYNVSKVTWSPDKNKAILEYPDDSNIIYDFQKKQQTTLPKHWKEFAYAPSGNQIVMKSIGLDPSNRWLAISNDDGSQTQPIEEIGENEATVFPSWSPNGQTIAMYTKGVDFNRQEIFFVGLHDENFKSMVIEGRDFRSAWSPNGDRLLYSVYSSDNDLKPMLWISGAQGDNIGANRKSLGLETWADKCVFVDSQNAICAVPTSLEKGAGLFPEMAQNTPDILYQIDTYTGLKKIIATPDSNLTMSNLIISNDKKYLYFVDSLTQSIHKINLK
ncbi:MAG: hypothetical protein PHT51_01675 [Patescibacteria group bacterium]|nr:hypothetical protein [Patescibacteria group bacterium]MDD4610870.1 hypothetical protein [Patescibacteria group bacterium]